MSGFDIRDDARRDSGQYDDWPAEKKDRTVSPKCWYGEHGDCKSSSFTCDCPCHKVEIDYFGASATDNPTPHPGYVRRQCSKCGEGLGFTEADPCDRCAPQPAGAPCCGWNVNRAYIVSDDNNMLKCPDCGKEYKRSEHEARKAVAQPAGKAGAPELLPCPFCGGTPRIDLTTWGFTVVRCLNPDCRASSYHRKERSAAIDAWNTRATPTDIAERSLRAVEKLRQANILLADPTEAELAEASEIIAAEFKSAE